MRRRTGRVNGALRRRTFAHCNETAPTSCSFSADAALAGLAAIRSPPMRPLLLAAPRPGARRAGSGGLAAAGAGAVARAFAYGPDPVPRRAGTAGSISPRAPGATVRAACSGPRGDRPPGPRHAALRPLARDAPAAGDRVGPPRRASRGRAAAPIGTLGAAAAGHAGLHLGVRRAGERFGYVDPLPFLERRRRRPPPSAGRARGAAARAARPPARRRRARAGRAARPARRARAARRPRAPARAVRRAAPARARASRRSRRGPVPVGVRVFAPATVRGRSRLGPPGSGSRCCCSARPGAGCGSGCGGVARGCGRRYRQRHDRRAAHRVRPRRLRGRPARADVAAGDPLDAAQRRRRSGSPSGPGSRSSTRCTRPPGRRARARS